MRETNVVIRTSAKGQKRIYVGGVRMAGVIKFDETQQHPDSGTVTITLSGRMVRHEMGD